MNVAKKTHQRGLRKSLDLLQYCSEHVLKLPEASRPEVVDHQPEFMHSYDFSLFSSEMPGERVLVKVWRGAAQLSNDQRKQITKVSPLHRYRTSKNNLSRGYPKNSVPGKVSSLIRISQPLKACSQGMDIYLPSFFRCV
jgi:hypothetical protein